MGQICRTMRQHERINLEITSIEGEESQVNDIDHFFNRLKGESILKLKKYISINIKETHRTLIDKARGEAVYRLIQLNTCYIEQRMGTEG